MDKLSTEIILHIFTLLPDCDKLSLASTNRQFNLLLSKVKFTEKYDQEDVIGKKWYNNIQYLKNVYITIYLPDKIKKIKLNENFSAKLKFPKNTKLKELIVPYNMQLAYNNIKLPISIEKCKSNIFDKNNISNFDELINLKTIKIREEIDLSNIPPNVKKLKFDGSYTNDDFSTHKENYKKIRQLKKLYLHYYYLTDHNFNNTNFINIFNYDIKYIVLRYDALNSINDDLNDLDKFKIYNNLSDSNINMIISKYNISHMYTLYEYEYTYSKFLFVLKT